MRGRGTGERSITSRAKALNRTGSIPPSLSTIAAAPLSPDAMFTIVGPGFRGHPL